MKYQPNRSGMTDVYIEKLDKRLMGLTEIVLSIDNNLEGLFWISGPCHHDSPL